MISKKIIKKINGFLENVTCYDTLKIKCDQLRHLQEGNIPIHGYVTVTKNKGRADEQIIQKDKHNLLTTLGRDFFHAQLYTNVIAGTKGANAIALSDDATDPVIGDTTLVGEFESGGLTRVEAGAIVHVAGTNLTTLEEVFTATIIFTAIHKSGLFNQDTIGGQMTQASEFDADVNLQVGDTITVLWVITTG